MKLFKFNGQHKKKNYFEGWYVHLLDSDKTIAYIIIFGITLNENDPHSFIQIVDKNDKEPYYFRFNNNDFYYNNDSIKIKNNILSPHQIIINEGDFNIDVSISGHTLIKNNLIMPSVMGCLKYLPLPTHIEVIFLNSIATGKINQNSFSGNAYMEKNWGRYFPSKWIWMESSNFENTSTSFVIAYADLLMGIDGFFAILDINGKQFRFATYNGFKANLVQSDKDKIILDITKKELTLKVFLEYKDEYKLVAPTTNAQMTRIIHESLNSTLKIELYRNQKLIYSDTANNAACENTFYIN